LVEKRRDQIVSAAINLFAKKGYHKTTLRDLAEEAGISHGNIYDYVGSKEDILFLIHEYQSARVLKVLDENDADTYPPLEKLRRMIVSDLNASYSAREATLLFYQETKSMQKERLRKLSEIERSRLARIEQVIEECIRTGKCRNVNPRLVSNLCKVMSDIWPLKSWDLTGHTTRHQIEKMVLDAVFTGILQVKPASAHTNPDQGLLDGMTILVLNMGKLLAESLFPYFIAAGVRVVSYQKGSQAFETSRVDLVRQESPEKLLLFHQNEHGPMGPELFSRISKEVGSIDGVITNWDFIQDGSSPAVSSWQEIDEDFRITQSLIPVLKTDMKERGAGKIIHITPSYWSRERDRMLYESTKARILALTDYLARELGGLNMTVNCLVPGYIDGLQSLIRGQEQSLQVEAQIPLRRLGRMDDFLESIRFLLSRNSSYLTGQVLEVSGGLE
ncbi:MAG: SDR family oxidoreductase, partial [bacterium]